MAVRRRSYWAGMKIVHVITRLILGGAQENTLLTCEHLARRGHDVTLITGPPLGPEGELLNRAGSGEYRLIVLDAMRREIHPARDWTTYRALRRQLAALAPDVVHTHSSKAGILGRRAAVRCGVGTIVHTIHGLPFHPYQTWWRNRLYVALERRAARQCDALVCVADAMARQALAVGVGRPDQYVTIRSGMELDRFLDRPENADAFRRGLRLPAGAVLVTQVSRLAELKGHKYLIAAASRLGSNVHFCLVGDGALRGSIERKIAVAGLADRFHLTGLVAPTEIPAILHASDVLVHCSLREGLARALPQAMLAGLPVVSFDVDGAAEVALNDRTGFCLPPRDVEALTLALQRLTADADLRDRLGRAGRELAARLFSAEKMVDQIEHLYQRLKGSARSRE